MNKIIKRTVVLLSFVMFVWPCVHGIETSRHIARIIEQLPCDLPQKGTFICHELDNQVKLYVERKGEAITQVGVRLFPEDVRETIDPVVCNAVERLWLELMLCKDVQKQKALMKEHRFSVVYNGFTLGTVQFPALSRAIHVFSPASSVSLKTDEGKIVLRIKGDEDALVITLPADRELLYSYDKKEHEDIIKEELSQWTQTYRNTAGLPSLDELVDLGNGVFVLPGQAYMIDSLKNETFYTVNTNRVSPLFSKDYPLMSMQNLLMGCVPTSKVDLHVRYRTYERKKVYCSMALSRFLGYMQHQGLDFYSAAYVTSEGATQCLLLMHHPIYDYIHMLVVNGTPSLFDGGHAVLEGDFYTFIPQHNIKSLFNF